MAEMVLDVAPTFVELVIEISEFAEDLPGALSHNVG